MHLINTSTYHLESHDRPRPYAILSHTWHENEEVLREDFTTRNDKGRIKKGFRKIRYLCEQAQQDQLEYAWIDTTCIDKTSSAELSESINSMFLWYQKAVVCYVYLDDVDDISELSRSRWLTRGWTLQELLAPQDVRFYNRDWVCLGTKASLVPDLVRLTRIDQIALTHSSTIPHHSAATRMSWAASRRTTRVEDMAYCLLGIFDVNMPLLYGEGRKAFRRLQEEILRQHWDVTLLAFDRTFVEADFGLSVLLAESPDAFGQQQKIIPELRYYQCGLTSRGLQLQLPTWKSPATDEADQNYHVVLNCRFEFETDQLIALPVEPWGAPGEYVVRASPLGKVPRHQLSDLPQHKILIVQKPSSSEGQLRLHSQRHVCSLSARILISHGFEILYAAPDLGINSWHQTSLVSELVSFGVSMRRFGYLHREHNECFVLSFAIDLPYYLFKVDLKPSQADHMAWLKYEDMFAALKPPSSGSEWNRRRRCSQANPAEKIDGVEWQLVFIDHPTMWSGPPIQTLLSLQSRRCFQSICIRLSKDSAETTGWTIDIEPIGHW